ncbi:MAG: YitT family protein [Clostridia bacterium]|nr:YitT family protein [Clostridia bacterium]
MNLAFLKDRKSLLTTLKNTALVILGTFVLALGTGMFVIPFDLVTGGVSGIGIVIKRLVGDAGFLGSLTTEFYASFVNWGLFFIGWIFLGKNFAAKTFISTLVYPVALMLASFLISDGFMGGFLNLASNKEYKEIAIILATVFSGAAIGAGCALTFLGGGSTGGIDIIAFTVCKFWKKGKSSVLIFVLDASIIIAGMFVLQDLVVSLLGILSAFICAIAIDKMFVGESGAFIAYVVSDKYEEINEAVIRRLVRTTTIINASGGFSGEEKVMLSVTFSRNQYAEFTAIMSEIDKNAFITVHGAHEIGGEGWTKYDDPEATDNLVIPRYAKKTELDTATKNDGADPNSN